MDHAKWRLTNPSGFHCPQPSELIFLPSNLFAKTDPDVLPPRLCFSKICAAKTCQHNHRTTFASSLEPPPFAPNTALWTMRNGALTNPSGFHCPQPGELIFLPSNLFAKTDPGCPATTVMFQQKYVPQKHVSITTARHSPHPLSPHPLRPTPLYGPCEMAPLPIPPGFIARNPANSFFCPQIFLPKPIPDVLPPRPCFSKNMRRKKSQHNHRTTFAEMPWVFISVH